MEENKPFLSTVPGILASVASLITALVGLMTFMKGGKAPAEVKPAVVAMASPFAQPQRPVGCGKVVGNWTWFLGGITTIAPDGHLSWYKNTGDLVPTALGT